MDVRAQVLEERRIQAGLGRVPRQVHSVRGGGRANLGDHGAKRARGPDGQPGVRGHALYAADRKGLSYEPPRTADAGPAPVSESFDLRPQGSHCGLGDRHSRRPCGLGLRLGHGLSLVRERRVKPCHGPRDVSPICVAFHRVDGSKTDARDVRQARLDQGRTLRSRNPGGHQLVRGVRGLEPAARRVRRAEPLGSDGGVREADKVRLGRDGDLPGREALPAGLLLLHGPREQVHPSRLGPCRASNRRRERWGGACQRFGCPHRRAGDCRCDARGRYSCGGYEPGRSGSDHACPGPRDRECDPAAAQHCHVRVL
eukprot:g5635.t1